MKVVVHMFGGAMFVVQSILWCGMGVVYGVYLVKSGVYLIIPFKNKCLSYFRTNASQVVGR